MIDFKKISRVHLVGVKGVGMTALTQFLVAKFPHITFSGSDVSDSFLTGAVLKQIGLFVQEFSKDNIGDDIDLVISSGAWFEPTSWRELTVKNNSIVKGRALNKNEDISCALKKNIPVITYPQAIGILSQKYRVIAVAGSHGKSTTTAMLAFALEKAGKGVSALVGTRVKKWESSGRVGRGRYLVVEADEYREAFLNYKPFGVIVTSIDWDHPDYYASKREYNRAFKRLISNVDPKGFVVGFGDDVQVRSLLTFAKQKKLRTCSYGFVKHNDIVLHDDGVFHGKQLFHTVFHSRKSKGKLPFPGWHYVANAGAVIASSQFLRANRALVLKGLAQFPGTARRFDVVKRTGSVVIDDYAHHPSEIKATLSGVRSMYPSRHIVALFQPHMFSRTETLLSDFASAFLDADEVGILKVYASAREKKGRVTSRDLVKAIQQNQSGVRYFGSDTSAQLFYKKSSKINNSVVVMMGAGDIRNILT